MVVGKEVKVSKEFEYYVRVKHIVYGKLDFYLNNFLLYYSERYKEKRKRRSKKAEGEDGEGRGIIKGVVDVIFFFIIIII